MLEFFAEIAHKTGMTRQWALITGASAGLGQEFARQLAASGKNLILVARRAEPMEELAMVLRQSAGIEVRIFTADLSEPEAPSAIFDFTREQGLSIDYLVNNAGANGPDLLTSRDWSKHRAYFELMMTSVAAMCHFFVPPMQERGFGRVVNVASVAGLIAAPGDYSYGSTKAYLVALSKSMAPIVKPDGVHVLALCPGFTHTDFHNSPKLTEMKRQSPGFLWHDADVVIREGLVALEKGKSVYASGRIYRWLVPILRSFVGRWILAAMNVTRGITAD